MRKAMFKGISGMALAREGLQTATLARAASHPEQRAFNTTATLFDIDEYEDQDSRPLSSGGPRAKKPRLDSLNHPKVNAAIEQARSDFGAVLAKGAGNAQVVAAVKTFLPATDAASLIRFCNAGLELLNTIPIAVELTSKMARNTTKSQCPLGEYVVAEGKIYLNPKLTDMEQAVVNQTLLHELMHSTGDLDYFLTGKQEIYHEKQCEKLAQQGQKALDNADSWYWAIQRAIRKK